MAKGSIRVKVAQFSLDDVKIASPCPVAWSSMEGDERKRFCTQCKQNVFNISEMSKDEAVELLSKQAGRACLRLYKRRDGTIITRDCNYGMFKVLKRFAWLSGLLVLLGNFIHQLQMACCTIITGGMAPISEPQRIYRANGNFKAGHVISRMDITSEPMNLGKFSGSIPGAVQSKDELVGNTFAHDVSIGDVLTTSDYKLDPYNVPWPPDY